MATQTTARIEGTIQDAAFKKIASGDRKGEMFGEYKILQTGKQYPVTVRDFDKVLEGCNKGDYIVLDVTERQGTYTDKEGKERSVTYRNAHGIIPQDEASEPFPGDAPPSGGPSETHQEAPQRRPAAQPSQDTREASIEAQVSVMQAREFLDRIIPMDLSMEEKIDLFKKHLPEVAHIVHATIREVKA